MTDDELCRLLQEMNRIRDEELRRHQPLVAAAMDRRHARAVAAYHLMARCNPYRRPDDIHPATLLDWERAAIARREEAGVVHGQDTAS